MGSIVTTLHDTADESSKHNRLHLSSQKTNREKDRRSATNQNGDSNVEIDVTHQGEEKTEVEEEKKRWKVDLGLNKRPVTK